LVDLVRINPEPTNPFTITPRENGRDSLWDFREKWILGREGGITKEFLTHNSMGVWKDGAYWGKTRAMYFFHKYIYGYKHRSPGVSIPPSLICNNITKHLMQDQRNFI